MTKSFLMMAAIAGLVCIALSGCTETYGRYLSTADLAKVKKGKSTKQDVVAILGNPDSSTVDLSGVTTFNYRYTKVTPAPVAIGSSPVVGNSGEVHQMTCVVFSPSGIVSSISSTTNSDVVRGKFGSDGVGRGAQVWAPAKLEGVPQSR